MRLTLREAARTDALVVLETALPPANVLQRLHYRTATGALLRIDGVVAGAYDREHHDVEIDPSGAERRLTLEVERRALPTNSLPSGDGVRWRLMLAKAQQEPQQTIEVQPADDGATPSATRGELTLWGHSHLDVAWLWSYSETRRKAMRTFANALAIVEHDPSFVFMQSQPQLYAFVEEADPEFFARVRAAVAQGRFDPQPAAMWVEPDCNATSGESLLRQMLAAHAYCVDRFGIEPAIAWLPDTFGFPNTLPTLLAHARIPYFATTKLQWNDTTVFPHPQFVWQGPDGSKVVSAMLASYEGSADASRIATARTRREPLVIGYGDGGGGPTLDQVRTAERAGTWQAPLLWFAGLERGAASLPVHADELYLEYHRGTYTTHHDVKSRNAELERLLHDVEERVSWCIAVRAPRDVVDRLRAQLRDAWQIVLRNQFHDVLPGTSVRSAYEESLEEYGAALEIAGFIRKSTEAMLPRAARFDAAPIGVEPVVDDDEIVLDNGIVHARLSTKGALLHLSASGGRNVVAQANLLAAYRDRPSKWEAWNLDAGYDRHRLPVNAVDFDVNGGALNVRFDVAGSPLAMRIALMANEPFLRVDASVDWRADRVILRLENWVTVGSGRVRFGSPHGTIERDMERQTPAGRARYEVPGQRFASIAEGDAGVAVFALDTYGWSARNLPDGGMQLGHSLLRAPRWPDPQSDRGEAQLSWAFAPHAAAPASALERAWEYFALPSRVRLFTTNDDAVLVVAVKPAENAEGVILRVRECDGAARAVRIRCGARMRAVQSVDALERPLDLPVAIDGEELVATLDPYGLRSFRVQFT
jgi:alpha-mannosidase